MKLLIIFNAGENLTGSAGGEWYRYREAAIKQIVIGWCESHGIEFGEE